MYVLGIETSGPVCSVGLVEGSRILGERSLTGARIHSVKLLPLISGLLEDLCLFPSDLAGIAVSAGPGSFTGLRIGLAVAKTLAQALDVPVAGVGSLDVLAFPLVQHCRDAVCAMVPARKKEVYAAVYAGKPSPGLGPVNVDVNGLSKLLAATLGPVVCVGEAAPLYVRELAAQGLAVTTAPLFFHQPRGITVALMGQERLGRGDKDDPLTLAARYLRKSQAELTWQGGRKGEDSRCG